jgi:EpsI family protein
MTKLTVALAFLSLNFYAYHYLGTGEVIPPRSSFESFPVELGEWRCVGRQEMDGKVLANLGATDYLICDLVHADSGVRASLYIGYHATQVRKEGGGAGENSIHPPEHCLPGSGWNSIDTRIVDLDAMGLPGEGDRRREAKRFIIAKGNARQLTYFWYQSRGRTLARNHEVILYRFWDRAIRNRTDGSLVRITIPIRRGDVERAEAIFREIAAEVMRLLPEYAPA